MKKTKARLYKRYPPSSLLIYNGATLLHFLVGGVGIMVGYNFSSWAGYAFGGLYLAFAFTEMYVLMPFKVCPNCVYYRLEGSLCISGLNVIAQKIARPGAPQDFHKRAKGWLCPNNLYLASLVLPLIAMLPALIINYSNLLLVLFLGVVGLLLYRVFVIFPKIACLHCQAKFQCPQAAMMGVRDL